MTITTSKRTVRTRLAAVVGGLAAITALGMTAPTATAAPDDGAPTGQVEKVTSDQPVMLSDLEPLAAGDKVCAVFDGKTGCYRGYTPGEDGLVVARLYAHSEFRGPSITVINPEYRVGCTGATSDHEGRFALSSTYLSETNNRISSVRTYNSCDVRLFDGFSFSSTKTGYIHWDNYLGTWNDRASAISIS